AWLEIASSATGFPAAACKISGEPAEAFSAAQRVLAAMGAGRYSVRLVDDRGAEIWHRHVMVDAQDGPRTAARRELRTALNTDDYRIRTYRPGDEVEINRLFNEIFGLSRTLQEWQNKFRSFGREPRIILVVDRADRIVTHYSGCEVPF